MKDDDEFSGKARNQYFTLFEEAYRNRNVRDWLGWNNDEYKYENEDNLKQFYSWISQDEENDDRRRIHNPRQIKLLGDIVDGGQKSLMTEIDQYESTIEQAWATIGDKDVLPDWRRRLERARKLIADLPQEAMFEEPKEFAKLLDVIAKQISKRKKAIRAIIDE